MPFYFFQLIAQGVYNPFINTAVRQLSGWEYANRIFSSFVSIGFVLGITIFLFILIWGGITWVGSRGDRASLEEARRRIMNGIVGLIILLLIFFILQVISWLFKIDITGVGLPGPRPTNPISTPGPNPTPSYCSITWGTCSGNLDCCLYPQDYCAGGFCVPPAPGACAPGASCVPGGGLTCADGSPPLCAGSCSVGCSGGNCQCCICLGGTGGGTPTPTPAACGESCSPSWIAVSTSRFPGTGDFQAYNQYTLGNSSLIQSYWRSNQAYARTVQISGGLPDFNCENNNTCPWVGIPDGPPGGPLGDIDSPVVCPACFRDGNGDGDCNDIYSNAARSFNQAFNPSNTLKQDVLSSDEQMLYYRLYQSGSWRPWAFTVVSELGLPGNPSRISGFFQTRGDAATGGNPRQVVISQNGETLYSRDYTGGSWGSWQTTQVTTLGLPGGATRIRSFNQSSNVSGVLRQDLLSTNGQDIFFRDRLGNSWGSWGTISVSSLGISGVTSVSSFNRTSDSLNGLLRLTVVSESRQTLYVREYDGINWGPWNSTTISSINLPGDVRNPAYPCGQGDVLAFNSYATPNNQLMFQSIWIGAPNSGSTNRGFTRRIPIRNGSPDLACVLVSPDLQYGGQWCWDLPASDPNYCCHWNLFLGNASPAPITISLDTICNPNICPLSNVGAMQALNTYFEPNVLRQGIWVGNRGYTRTINLVGGEPDFSCQASGQCPWSPQPPAPPLNPEQFPGDGEVQGMGSYSLPNASTPQWRQTYLKNNVGWGRTIPLNSGGSINWGAWTEPCTQSNDEIFCIDFAWDNPDTGGMCRNDDCGYQFSEGNCTRCSGGPTNTPPMFTLPPPYPTNTPGPTVPPSGSCVRDTSNPNRCIGTCPPGQTYVFGCEGTWPSCGTQFAFCM